MEFLDQNMELILLLTSSRPDYYMVSDNPNIIVGILDCLTDTRRIALNDNYQKKRMKMQMLAYTHVDCNYPDTLAKTFTICGREAQFFQGSVLTNAPVLGDSPRSNNYPHGNGHAKKCSKLFFTKRSPSAEPLFLYSSGSLF